MQPVYLFNKWRAPIASQIELTSETPIELDLHNVAGEVNVYIRSSCDDLSLGTKLASLTEDLEHIAIEVVDVTKTVDQREDAPAYPSDFPLKKFRGQKTQYSKLFCKEICHNFR